MLKVAAATTGVAVGSGAITGFPTTWAQNIKGIVLRHSGPPVTAVPAIAERASKDLGFTVQMQAVPLSKMKNWDQTIPLFSKSEYPDGRKAPHYGTGPYTVLYANDATGQTFHSDPSDWLTGVPTVTNADTIGIRPDLVGRKIASWADLLAPGFLGKPALQDQPSGGAVPQCCLHLPALESRISRLRLHPGQMANIPVSFSRSIGLASVVSILTVVFSVAAGLGFRRRFPGSGVVFYIAVASLVMPSLLVGFGIGLGFQFLGWQTSLFTSALGAQLTWRTLAPAPFSGCVTSRRQLLLPVGALRLRQDQDLAHDRGA